MYIMMYTMQLWSLLWKLSTKNSKRINNYLYAAYACSLLHSLRHMTCKNIHVPDNSLDHPQHSVATVMYTLHVLLQLESLPGLGHQQIARRLAELGGIV